MRREAHESQKRLNNKKLKVIKQVQGNNYAHKVLEKQFIDIEDYEAARREKQIAEMKEKKRKQYEEISKQRMQYAQVMKKAGEGRENASRIFENSDKNQ